MKNASSRVRSSALLFALGLIGAIPVVGCDRLKNAMGKGDGDGGETVINGEGQGIAKVTVPGPLAFLNDFEGEVDVLAKGHMEHGGRHGPGAMGASANPDAPMNIALLMKHGKIRADLPAGLAGSQGMGNAYAIYDSAAKKAYFVMDAQKQAVLFDLNNTGETLKNIAASRGGPQGPGTPAKAPPKIVKTGKSDTVAGYKCEIWDITTDESKGTVCIAEERVSWFQIPMMGAPAEYAWASEFMDGKHIPLRFVGYDKSGAEDGRVEVSKIDKKSEPDALFEVPPGYAVMSMEQMIQAQMQQMQGAMRGAGGTGGFGGAPGAPPDLSGMVGPAGAGRGLPGRPPHPHR